MNNLGKTETGRQLNQIIDSNRTRQDRSVG